MKIYQLLIFAFLLIFTNAFSQIGVGEWRDHLPYSNGIKVAVAGEKIYCATESNVFYYNKSDESVNKISKVHGLSDIGMSSIAYNVEYDILFIAYSNSNIDLISGQTIYNIPDIKRKQITGNKIINNIMFINQFAYLSCGFGIVVVDIEKKEIKDTYLIGSNGSQINVYGLTTDNNHFYAATEKGIFKAEQDDEFLVNFANWHHIDDAPQNNKKFSSIAYFNNNIYAAYENEDGLGKDTLFVFNGNTWSKVDTIFKNIVKITTSNNKLIVCQNYEMEVISVNGSTTKYIYLRPYDAVFDSDNNLWIADKYYGLRKAISTTSFKDYYPNGPYSNNVVNMDVQGSNLFSVIGGVNGSWGNLWKSAEINMFIDNEWKTYRTGTYKDIMSIIVDPSNPSKAYAGSWNGGILEFNNGEFVKVYDESNSTLQSVISGQKFVKIGGMAFDSENNLWVSVSSDGDTPVSVMLPDGTWYGFKYGSLFYNYVTSDIMATQYNHKWILLPRGAGLFAFDEKGTYDDLTDDDTKEFSILDETGKVITNDIHSFAEDLDGDIWIGTNEGVLVYYDAENVFTGDNFYAQKIIIEIDGNTQYLLETETVTAIEIDGANKKWIGTRNAGVFLMSADGTEQILNFNTENSPLISNNIASIAIDNITGEVFFGTSKGIISYKSTATMGDDDFNKVYVYPNPVKHDYLGLITVTGLVANANVKITDITGNIVYEITAEGGQAIWDGNDFSGNRVHTGVYLVFCSNEDGSKTHITKILFIN